MDINTNKLFLAILEDGEKVFDGIKFDRTGIYLPEEIQLDEYQYYIHKVGFYMTHTLTWCKQLNLSIEFLSNFDYSKKISASRADHLIYNIENYLIRLNSVYDRVLQLVNAVFHLCISEENVGHSVIVSNYKVQHRPKICSAIKSVQKYLRNDAQARHTLIHKHSYMDVKLRKIELFYLNNLDNLPKDDVLKKQLKQYRANYLRDYLSEKKEEFRKVNTGLFEKLNNLFDLLLKEYERQKKNLL